MTERVRKVEKTLNEQEKYELERTQASGLLGIVSALFTIFTIFAIFSNIDPSTKPLIVGILMGIDLITFFGALYYRPKSELTKRLENLEATVDSKEVDYSPYKKDSDLLARIENLEDEVKYIRKLIDNMKQEI